MSRHGDDAREALLDSAEELFARYGIDAVSHRRIAEHAGTANHSAVQYHFGGRDGLMRALLARGRLSMGERRAQLLSALPARPALRGLVSAHILPWTEHLDALPVPSWRARFLLQGVSVPSVAKALKDRAAQENQLEDLLPESMTELDGIPRSVLRNRSRLLGGMVLRVCAGFEEQREQRSTEGDWSSVGYFLIDAATGLLAAPVTEPADFLTQSRLPIS